MPLCAQDIYEYEYTGIVVYIWCIYAGYARMIITKMNVCIYCVYN